MATAAPAPGASRRNQTQDTIIRICDGSVTLELNIGTLGPRDDLLVRQASGIVLPKLVEADAFDSFSLCVLWWLARVKSGEEVDGSPLTLDAVLDQYPTYESLSGFEVERVEPDEAEQTPEG